MSAIKSEKVKVMIKNALITVGVPLAVGLIMEILDYSIVGMHLLSLKVDWISLFRNVIITFCFALGLNCNLPLGRMDTSAGAQMYLGCILGGNIAISVSQKIGGHFTSTLILLFSVVIGMIAGLIVGYIFIKLKILPMVLGLGVSLVYECISFAVNNNQGLSFYGTKTNLSQIWYICAVVLIIMIVMMYFFEFSSFGYERRAIQGNQKIAYEYGINIYSNAVICYILAGALVTIAGIFTTAYNTSLPPVLGMTSNKLVFSNLFPMAVGMRIAKKSNPVIGILMGSLTVQLLCAGLAKFTMIGLSSEMQAVIKYSCWLLFMIYNNNSYRFENMKLRKERIAKARELKNSLGV